MKSKLLVTALSAALAVAACTSPQTQLLETGSPLTTSKTNLQVPDTPPIKGQKIKVGEVLKTDKEKRWDELKAKPKNFSHKIDKSIRSDGKHAIFKTSKGGVYEIDPEQSLVIFNQDATQGDVKRFLKDFHATIVSTVSEQQKAYRISFDLDEVVIDEVKFKKNAENKLADGEYAFADTMSEKLFYQVLESDQSGPEYKVSGVGFCTLTGEVSSEATYFESGGYSSPTNYWHHARMNTSGWTGGNNINNTTGDNALALTAAAGVNIAVVDEGMYLSTGEVAQNNPQLLGSGTVQTWNVGANNATLSTVPGHGRRVASLIFSPFGDAKGAAGQACQSNPILIECGYLGGDASVARTKLTNGILKASELNAKIINCSWTTRFSATEDQTEEQVALSDQLYTAVYAANQQKRIIVAATGNRGDLEIGNYPAKYSEAIGVSAHNSNGERAYIASESNYANSNWADIWAGGQAVRVADNTAAPNIGSMTADGTSYSTPIISATIAQMIHRGLVTSKATAISRLISGSWQYTKNGRSYKVLDAYYTLTF
jgi:hypothetical protein